MGSESSSSSSTSTDSSDSNGESGARAAEQQTGKERLHGQAEISSISTDAVRPPGVPPALPLDSESFNGTLPLQWLSSKKRYRCLAIAPRVLSQQDICNLHAAARHHSVREINDRKGYLAFKQTTNSGRSFLSAASVAGS